MSKRSPKRYRSTRGFVSSAKWDEELEGGERMIGRKEKEEKKVHEEPAQKQTWVKPQQCGEEGRC